MLRKAFIFSLIVTKNHDTHDVLHMSYQCLDMLYTELILILDMVEIRYGIRMLFIRSDVPPFIKS